jgi:hypothetical protein
LYKAGAPHILQIDGIVFDLGEVSVISSSINKYRQCVYLKNIVNSLRSKEYKMFFFSETSLTRSEGKEE